MQRMYLFACVDAQIEFLPKLIISVLHNGLFDVSVKTIKTIDRRATRNFLGQGRFYGVRAL